MLKIKKIFALLKNSKLCIKEIYVSYIRITLFNHVDRSTPQQVRSNKKCKMYHASLPQKFHQAMQQKCRDISSAFYRFIIQAENCFSRLTRNPDRMAELYQAATQHRKEAWELQIIFFFSYPFFASGNFYPFVLPFVTRWIRRSRGSC